jgi:Glycosyltransferase family 87
MTSGEVPRWWRRLDTAGGGIPVDAVLYAASAGFAAITAYNRMLPPHGAWGRVAVFGYAAAALVALVLLVARRTGRFHRCTGTAGRTLLTILTFAATALLPLLIQATQRAGGRTDRAQDEVSVIEAGGSRLWHTGTPYLDRADILGLPSGLRLHAYLPYQPGMALFGLPRAIAGVAWWTDARVWFAAVLIATVLTAVVLVRRAAGSGRDRELLRAVQAVAVLPICALTIATGGDDLAVLGLCVLALAYASRDRFGAAGIAVGIAGALKLFAWPVALVLLALAATRGRRVTGRYALGAIGLPVVALIPAFLVDPGAAVENVVRFPLGRGVVASPAESPFPGQLIAAHLPAGHLIATGLLVLAAVGIGVWLIRRPPRTAFAAAVVSAWGLLAAILLIPSTRFGYLLYPVAYLAWAPALRAVSAPPARPAGAEPADAVPAGG